MHIYVTPMCAPVYCPQFISKPHLKTILEITGPTCLNSTTPQVVNPLSGTLTHHVCVCVCVWSHCGVCVFAHNGQRWSCVRGHTVLSIKW
jgi:hypothetical protein